MQYKDLNLKAIRDELELDFAHFTFLPGQCSCCYGPMDMPARYWRNGKPEEGSDRAENPTYLLFKNANNGSGSVRRADEIEGIVYVLWEMPEDVMKKACAMLSKQLGPDYYVVIPPDKSDCITIFDTFYYKAIFRASVQSLRNLPHQKIWAGVDKKTLSEAGLSDRAFTVDAVKRTLQNGVPRQTDTPLAI